MLKDWLDLYKRIYENAGDVGPLVCPECGSSSVDFQYVGDEESRIGYVAMWCANCNKGASLSRVAIPPGAPFLSFDAPIQDVAARIPDFTQISV